MTGKCINSWCSKSAEQQEKKWISCFIKNSQAGQLTPKVKRLHLWKNSIFSSWLENLKKDPKKAEMLRQG